MADTMQFDLVSPERKLASVEATAVQLPGSEGDMTAMPDHAPMITTLRPGIVTIETGKGRDEYALTGGFAEITPEGTTVLANRALHVSEVTQAIIDEFVGEAQARLEAAQQNGQNDLVDDAARFLADMVALGDHINLGSGMLPG